MGLEINEADAPRIWTYYLDNNTYQIEIFKNGLSFSSNFYARFRYPRQSYDLDHLKFFLAELMGLVVHECKLEEIYAFVDIFREIMDKVDPSH
jgi:hypothetical protein